jgi:hypothetical protein
VVALAGLVSVSAGVVLLNPVLVLCGLAMTTSALLMRRISWDLALPAAVIVLLATSTVVGVAGSLVAIDLLAWPWILAAGYLAYAVGGLWWTWRSPAVASWTSSAPDGGHDWIAYAPGAIAAAIGLAQSFSERMAASWALAGTDLAQHMINLEDVQRAGSLSYSTTGYPRAFHMMAAFASVPSPPLDHSVQLLGYDMRLVAAATWLSLALVLWAGATLAIRLGAARGVPRLVTVGAAVLFGAGALLTNTFILTFVYLGAAPSFLAIVVLFALPLAALGVTTTRRRVLVLPLLAATSVMLLAHLWQTLIVVPPLALAAYGAPRLRRVLTLSALRRPPLGLVKPLGPVLAASMVLLAVGSVPLLSIQTAGGIALASTPGNIPAAPWPVLVLGLAVAAWMIRDFRRGSSRLYLGTVTGLLLAAAAMLRGANHGFDLGQYYPMKVLWFLTIVLGPILALATVDLGWRLLRPVWRRLGRLGRFTRICRFAVAATLCALAFAFCLPPLLGTGSTTRAVLERQLPSPGRVNALSLSAVSAERWDIATRYGTRYSPAVTVPIAVGLSTGWNDFGPLIIAKLISFQTGQPQNHGQTADVCSDIAQVTGGSADAVVITQMKVDVLRAIMTKKGCGDVRVVHLPGRT